MQFAQLNSLRYNDHLGIIPSYNTPSPLSESTDNYRPLHQAFKLKFRTKYNSFCSANSMWIQASLFNIHHLSDYIMVKYFPCNSIPVMVIIFSFPVTVTSFHYNQDGFKHFNHIFWRINKISELVNLCSIDSSKSFVCFFECRFYCGFCVIYFISYRLNLS